MPTSSHLLFLCACAATLALLQAACNRDKLPYKCTCMNPNAVQCDGLSKFPPPGNFTDFHNFVFTNCIFNTIGGDNIPDYTQAKSLTLANCQIKEIQDGSLYSLSELETLQITGNFLTNLTREAMYLLQLKRLYLTHNGLTALPADVFYDLPELTKLTIDNDDLSQLPENIFEKNLKLDHLNLDFGKFTEIPKAVTKVPSLKSFVFNGNTIGPLTAETLKDFPSLTRLELSTCGLRTIDPQAFSGQTQLTELYLGYNDLTDLHRDTFLPMKGSLKLLFLDSNKLTTLENGTLPVGTLESIQLGHNPWHCDKRLAWMKDLHLEKIDHENVTCAGPPALTGLQLANVTRDMMHAHTGDNSRTKSMIAAAIAIPVIVVCLLLIFCILLRLYQNRRQRKRAQVRYSAVYRETTEPARPGHHRPTSVI